MLPTLSILLTTLLATLAIAATKATSSDFQFTKLSIVRTAGANVTLTFTIHDPDPLTNATQECTGSWKTGSQGFPSGAYEFCGNSSFAWRIENWNGISDFTLDTEHSYEDPAIGDPPYDYIDNFAKANITSANAPCRTLKGVKTCAQPEGGIIYAPIYASAA